MLAMLAMLVSDPALAQTRPRAGAGDPHDQSVDYRSDQVVHVQSAPGYQVTIELAPDEHVQSTALGDIGAWQVTSDTAGNHLFAKPLQAGHVTNMTVITNVRRYSFVLESLRKPTSSMPYTLRFRYSGLASNSGILSDIQAAPTVNYRISGHKALRPLSVHDDGVHTYIDWAPETDLPAVYRLDQMDRETLANGYMRGGTYVLDDIANHLLFRIDRHVARADRQLSRGKTP